MFPEIVGRERHYTIVGLARGERATYSPHDGLDASPLWTADSQLVIDRRGRRPERTVVDPASGRLNRTPNLPGREPDNLVYGPGGRAHRIVLGDAEGDPVGLETYDERLRSLGRVEAPLVLGRDRQFTPLAASADRFAFVRRDAPGLPDGVLVTDAELQPLHELQCDGEFPWDAVGWLDSETLVLYSVLTSGSDGKRPVVAWRPQAGEVTTLATTTARRRRDTLILELSPAALAAT